MGPSETAQPPDVAAGEIARNRVNNQGRLAVVEDEAKLPVGADRNGRDGPVVQLQKLGDGRIRVPVRERQRRGAHTERGADVEPRLAGRRVSVVAERKKRPCLAYSDLHDELRS